jgi:hypothetical protein
MRGTSFCIVLVLLLTVLLLVSASKVQKKRNIENCTKHCVHVKGHSKGHCKLSCEASFNYPARTLSIFENGVPVTDSRTHEAMSENVLLNLPHIRFDKALFNTPSAFDEMVQWTHVLKQQVAARAEATLETHDGNQFHLLPMPIPLTGEQLSNKEFMNRLVDVVPDSDLVYKESSPLLFSESYKQFLLDVKIDQQYLQNGAHTPEVEARIRQLEDAIQHDMNTFLALGDRCYAAYEDHLRANQLKRIAYTFDTFAPNNGDCVQADQHMIAHENHSKELAEYLKSLNPFDELFQAIASQTEFKQDWNFNREAIDQFTNEHVNLENAGAAMPSRFQIIVNMIRYYLKQEYFGNDVNLEESCLHAHLDFSAMGWKEVPITPHQWFNLGILEKYRHYPSNSNRNYFGQGGLLQRMVSKLVIAYKPTLKFVVTKAMKESFVSHSAQRNYRALELGPFVYDRVEFNSNSGTSMVDTYEMVITTNTRDPQVIGFKTRSFSPLNVPRLDTNEFAYCRREAACHVSSTPLVAIHRYSGHGHHFYTSNFGELGGGGNGWAYEGVQGHCYPHQVEGTVPLYRYANGRAGRHHYTTNYGELGGGRDGWGLEGVVCYVHMDAVAGTTPWYRFFNQGLNDHLFTTNPNEVSQSPPAQARGIFAALFAKLVWHSEGIACHLFTQSTVDKAIGCCKCN